MIKKQEIKSALAVLMCLSLIGTTFSGCVTQKTVDEVSSQTEVLKNEALEKELSSVLTADISDKTVVRCQGTQFLNLNLMADFVLDINNGKNSSVKGILNGYTSPIGYKIWAENGTLALATRSMTDKTVNTYIVTDIYENDDFYCLTNKDSLFFAIPKWNYTFLEKENAGEFEQNKSLISAVLKAHLALNADRSVLSYYGAVVPDNIPVKNISGEMVEKVKMQGKVFYKVEVKDGEQTDFYYISEDRKTIFSVSMVAGELIPIAFTDDMTHIKID